MGGVENTYRGQYIAQMMLDELYFDIQVGSDGVRRGEINVRRAAERIAAYVDKQVRLAKGEAA